jgi:hypothetical protein
MAAGDFSASTLPDVIIKINEMFSGVRHTPELNLPVETVKALAERQTVRFDKVDVLLDHMDCRGSKVVWLKDCSSTVVDLIATPLDSCTLTGAETESTYLSLANNLAYSDTFKVSEEDCADAFTAAEKIAYLMASKMASLENKINLAAIAFLTANEQAPADDLGYTLDGNIVNVPAANFTPTLLADMAVIGELSNLYSPFIVSGKNFYTARFLADYKSVANDNVDRAMTAGPMDIVWDIKNIDTTVGANATFLVDPSAYAFWSSNQFQNTTPQPRHQGSNVLVWKQRAPRLMFNNGGTLTPVYFDMEHQIACQVAPAGTRTNVHVFSITFRGGLQLGPRVCVSGDTGILQFNSITE